MAYPRRSIHELDSLITQYQHLLSTVPRAHPLRAPRVHSLALARFDRYELSNQKDDLDMAILHVTELMLIHPRLWQEHGPVMLTTLFLLASMLIDRSKVSELPEDSIWAAKYLRYLRDQPHQASGMPRHLVTTLLVDTLAFQVRLKAGNVMRNIGEMADLCHELITLDTPDVDTTRRSILGSITLLCGAVTVNIKLDLWVPDQPLDQVIECLRLARKRELSTKHSTRFALAWCLFCRYWMTYVDGDYEEVASILDEIITSTPEDSQDKSGAMAQLLVTLLAKVRSRTHQTPEYLEEEMYRTRSFIGSPSFGDGGRHRPLDFNLEDTAKERFRFFGSIEGLGASSGDSASSSPWPAVPIEGREGVKPELRRELENVNLLRGLLSGIPNDDVREIDEAIGKGRAILASSDPNYALTFYLFSTFSDVLFDAFERTNKIEFLNESIDTRRQVFGRPMAQGLRVRTLYHLYLALYARYQSFPGYCARDIDEALELLSQCVDDEQAGLPDRFRIACWWASFARRTQHSSVTTAYESTITLMQNAPLFAPTLQLQHATLATSDEFHCIPMDYASYQVDLGQLEEAIETLERGRALLWSEMRHLRTSVGQLLQVDPQLGRKFTAINRDLEELTKSISPSHKLSVDDGAAGDFRAVDPFGRLLLKQRALLKERDDLISQVQALPGFGSFLTSPSFDKLRSAASSGPVIIVNHSKWRSNILIVCCNTAPSLISTPDDFFSRASALKDVLLDARNKHGPDSTQYNQTLADVLTELYDLVGKPVIDRLRQLKVPEQSRVWWCPTSVFCSLPLHAMGPIPSGDGSGGERYFLDLYIPSYTPTLSALVPENDHREPGSPTLGVLPSLLLVAHFDVPSPDVPLSEVCEDVKVVQALNTRLPVKSLISEGATATSALDGLRDHPFVHFVCHGTLEAQKPFDAGFELHGHERLTLLRIVRSQLPAAEFAFLSACHTAGLTDGSSADEGLHLAAAVQYCGFRSVVGTMWAMANMDGADLAKHFYKTMFPKRGQGEPVVPYYQRSAGALREAVKKLRKKRGITLERWVNFVHYGA